MANNQHFYGTPLSRSLNNDKEGSGDGPINSRRARITQLQTVKDDQGRQRFHGAFTGGFSAGYYNTVDTLEGFRPCQFITHRKDGPRNVTSSSRPLHKPEDYMDEEDLGEFGIAPRKIRISNGFTSNSGEFKERVDAGIRSTLQNIISSSAPSLGEKILRRMSIGLNQGRKCYIDPVGDVSSGILFATKNDFHGLGYKPLKNSNYSSSYVKRSKNPLTAVFNDGKRLKIYGEAFGSGVLDEDEDFSETYGYDDISNYEFRKSSGENKTKSSNYYKSDTHCQDHGQLPDFVLSKLNSLDLCDTIKKDYPPPSIPNDWLEPVGKKPILPHLKPSVDLTLQSAISSSVFNQKFISGSSFKACDIDKKVGLVSYSDLKAAESNLVTTKSTTKEPKCTTEAKVEREELEWHPCSLLCVRFNVPNPYKDNSFVGVRPSELTIKDDDLKSNKPEYTSTFRREEYYERLGISTELKKSIFNTVFNDDKLEDLKETDPSGDSFFGSEDEPEVVEVKGDYHRGEGNEEERKSDEDLDIVVVAAPKREPEVIVLSSSSSTASPSPPARSMRKKSEHRCQHQQVLDEHDVELYGPPLPPTLQAIMDVDCSSSTRHRSTLKSKRRKRKKHKNSKRINSLISS